LILKTIVGGVIGGIVGFCGIRELAAWLAGMLWMFYLLSPHISEPA
jgi:uncharacterized membrane protein YtjA (UPF0391 family)